MLPGNNSYKPLLGCGDTAAGAKITILESYSDGVYFLKNSNRDHLNELYEVMRNIGALTDTYRYYDDIRVIRKAVISFEPKLSEAINHLLMKRNILFILFLFIGFAASAQQNINDSLKDEKLFKQLVQLKGQVLKDIKSSAVYLIQTVCY